MLSPPFILLALPVPYVYQHAYPSLQLFAYLRSAVHELGTGDLHFRESGIERPLLSVWRCPFVEQSSGMMDLTSYCLGGRTNSKAPRWKPQPLLPCLASDEKPLTRLGSPLGFSLYRRVLTWAFFTFALLAFLLYQSKGDSALYNTTVSQWSYAAPLSSSLDDYIPPTSHDNNEEEGDVRETIVSQSSVGQESEWMLDQDERWHQQYQEALQRTPWLRFKQ